MSFDKGRRGDRGGRGRDKRDGFGGDDFGGGGLIGIGCLVRGGDFVFRGGVTGLIGIFVSLNWLNRRLSGPCQRVYTGVNGYGPCL